MAPPPPPPPPAGAYGNAGGGYYSSNAGSSSSNAARRRLGLQNQNTGGASASQDDWFGSSAQAPGSTTAPSAPSPSPAPASGSSSGFYSMNAGGGAYGAPNNPYGGSGATASSAAGTTGRGGFYGGSAGGGGGYAGSAGNSMSGAMGGAGGGGYAGSSAGNAMSGAMGATPAPAAVPPAGAFGANPNSGSSAQMSLGGANSFEMGGGAMSGSMGGPIGGAATAPAAASAPKVFDPNAAAAAKNTEQSNAMTPAYEEDYDNEPPLLEELGVNFPHIYSKSKAVLFPFGKHAKSLESELIEHDADLAGPLAFALGLGGELLLAGKMHFGYVYGFGVSGCFAMTLLLNLLNPNGAVSMWTVVSILGYALLPVNLLAGVNVLVKVQNLGKWGMLASILTIVWCTTSSARLFERGCNMRAQRFLVAYPTALLYSAFVMLTIF